MAEVELNEELNNAIDHARGELENGKIVNCWMPVGWYSMGMARWELPDVVCHAEFDADLLDELMTYIQENVPMDKDVIFEYPMLSVGEGDEPARFKLLTVPDGSIEEYLPLIPMLYPNNKLMQLLIPDNNNVLPDEDGYIGRGQPLFVDTPDYLELAIEVTADAGGEEEDEDEGTDRED